MVDVVVVVTMVSDYLVKTALQGQPSLNGLFWIAIKSWKNLYMKLYSMTW